MRYLVLVLLALFVVPVNVSAQEEAPAQPAPEIVQIKENIHLLISPQGGNIVVSTGEDGTFIIDDNLAGRSEVIKAAIKTISDKDIQFVLNTHYHFDHTGNNEALGQGNAIIVAHDNVRKRLSSDQFITFFKKDMPALSASGLPVVTFADGITVHYNGDDVQVIHMPAAHTDGDAIAYFKEANVIAAGDTIFNNMYPFIDIEHGGSIKGVIMALDKMLNLGNSQTTILPGHGPAMDKTELRTYRRTLNDIMGKVNKVVKDGKTLDEALAMKLTAEYDEKMGGGIVGPDAFVTILHDNLKE